MPARNPGENEILLSFQNAKLIRTWIFLSIPIVLLMGKCYYDTNSVEVEHYSVYHSPPGKSLAGIKVAFLSDLHIKQIKARENLVLQILEKEKPDLILLGGDYIGFQGSYEPALSFLSRLKAPLGVYGTLGNTDYSNENESCTLCHTKNSKGLKENPSPVFLRNSFVAIHHKGRIVNLVGLDDPVGKRSDWNKATVGIDPDAAVILLAHSPVVFEEATRRGIDFVLCGHTHGGQIFPVKYAAKYLRKILPLDPALKYPDGFFKRGKTLMYVGRGVGTSFLPFRLGVKPEMAFFTFSDRPKDDKNISEISKSSSKVLFAGFDMASLAGIFNIFNSSYGPKDNPNGSATDDVLFDFETDSELSRLNWQCHKWFERSSDHATSGKYSLRAILPPGKYPGISFREFKEDWSGRNYLKLDVFNPAMEELVFHIRIDDRKSGWEYANRFDRNFQLKPGMNHISVPLNSLRTNRDPRTLDLRHIKRLIVFIPNNLEKREIYIDSIRLK